MREIKVKLYEFQRIGVERCIESLNNKSCVLLCDEQGLGKTIECLSIIENMPSVKRVLVICPTFAVTEWLRIIEDNSNFTYCAIDDNGDLRNRALINVIGYDRYRIIGKYFPYKRYDMVICDEFQFIKNPDALQSEAVRSYRYPYVIMTSGTPILNKPSEFWSPLDYCLSGKFGTYQEFYNKYTEVERKLILVKPKRRKWFRKVIFVPIGSKNEDKLKKKLKPIMIRRLKKNVLKDLPDKTYQKIDVELSGKQEKIYNRIRKQLLRKIDGRKINVLSALTRFGLLRQVCCVYQDSKVYSSKLEALKSLIPSIIESGHKIFIATPYIAIAEMLSKELKEYGTVCITSKTTGDIASMRNRFQNKKGKPRIYIGTIGKHQGAITLTTASYIIFFGKDLVPKRNEQVEDRLHRIGQKNNVNVITINAKDTVDTRVEEILQTKDKIVNGILSGSSHITLRDIRDLIK